MENQVTVAGQACQQKPSFRSHVRETGGLVRREDRDLGNRVGLEGEHVMGEAMMIS